MDPNDQNNNQPTQPAAAVPPIPVDGTPQQQQSAFNAQMDAKRQPKAITIKFEEDLKFEVTSDVVDDMRFMDLYAEVSEDQLKVTKLIKFLIGADNYESIFNYYESRGQRFTITKFGEVFEQLDKDLNSNPDFLSR